MFVKVDSLLNGNLMLNVMLRTINEIMYENPSQSIKALNCF